MPSVVPEDGSFPELVEVPDDGEGATSASLKDTFVQDLANRTRNANNILTVSGIDKIRTVASTTALKAVTGMTTGSVRYIDGLGLYYYLSTSPTNEALPWVVKPDSVVLPATGRWIHELAGLIVDTTSTGIATFGANGKVLNPVPFRIVGTHLQKKSPAVADNDSDSIVSTASTSYFEPTGGNRVGVSSDADAVQAGDRIQITASIHLYCYATAYARLKVSELGVSTPLTECWGKVTRDVKRFEWSTEHIAAAGAARTLAVDVEFRTTSATNLAYLYKPSVVKIVIVRP